MRPIATLTTLLAALLLTPSQALAAGDWTWPVAAEVVTQFHNGTDPYAAGQHRGVDIAAPAGTRVAAATAGTVTYAGVVGSSGLTVAERTTDGRYVLSYLHLSSLAVRRGQTVRPGDALGAAGTTGTRSVEQPHLHFGVREAADQHAYIDPLRFLAPPPAAPEAPRPAPLPVEVPVAAPPVAAPVAGLAEQAAATAPAPAPAATPAPVPPPSPAPAPGHAATRLIPRAEPGALQPHGPRAAVTAQPAAAAGSRARFAQPQPAAPSRDSAGRHPTAAEARPRQRPIATVPAAGPRAAGATAHDRPAPSAPPEPRATARPGRGINLAWLAACIGLIAAAVLLAGPGGGGDRKRPGARAVFATLLRAASRG